MLDLRRSWQDTTIQLRSDLMALLLAGEMTRPVKSDRHPLLPASHIDQFSKYKTHGSGLLAQILFYLMTLLYLMTLPALDFLLLNDPILINGRPKIKIKTIPFR